MRRTQDLFPCATAVSPKKRTFTSLRWLEMNSLGASRVLGDHLSFFVKIAIGIHAEELIGENALHHSGVAVGDGFRPIGSRFP